jgi:hypothetical protein
VVKAYKIKFSDPKLAVNGKPIEEVEKTITPKQKEEGVVAIPLRPAEKDFLSNMAQAVFARENTLAIFNQMAVLTDEIQAADDSVTVSLEDLTRLQTSITNRAKSLGEEKMGDFFQFRNIILQVKSPEEIELKEPEKK